VSEEIETSHMPSDLNQETFRVSLLPHRRAGHLMTVHVWFFIMLECKPKVSQNPVGDRFYPKPWRGAAS